MTLDDLRDKIYGPKEVVGKIGRTGLGLERFGGKVEETAKGEGGVTRFRCRTARNEYSIIAIEKSDRRSRGYLGAEASIIDGGGRALADGAFTIGTWHHILADIVAFELGGGQAPE